MSLSGTGDSGGSAPDAMLTQAAQVDDDPYSPDISTPADDDTEPTDDANTNSIASPRNGIAKPDEFLNNKRKSPPGSPNPSQSQLAKRVRIEDEPRGSNVALDSAVDRAKQLPAEIWHHIFTLLPPRALGCLLLVNKLFHTCLHPCPSVCIPSCHSTPHGALRPLKPDSIWQTSRRLFWPRMPAPLKGKSELEMWRLACSISCQYCASKGDLQSSTAGDQWHRGPGAKGVSPVFPFSVSICGSCLTSKSVKVCTSLCVANSTILPFPQEIEILLSSSIPSLLLPALPVVLIMDQLHVIPPCVMQTGTLPSQSQVTKVFWSHHLEEIKLEFETVKLLGSAAAEEWIKGLEARGKQALADASRWEKWDLAGGIHRMRTSLSSVSSSLLESTKMNSSGPSSSHPASGHNLELLHQSDRHHTEHQRQASEQDGIPGLMTKVDADNVPSRPQGQQKRTKEEVAELKLARRLQIEQRALQLDPPLEPSVLAHIPSFQAALQIITPLDDNAWGLLKPRILAQRQEAELREKEKTANSRALQERLERNKEGVVVSKEPWEVTDKDWDDIQGPLRARISKFADEIIRDGWSDGDKVKKKNSPQFAADVLLYVRKRFYAEVAKDAAAAVAAGLEPVLDPPEGPWTQKLTLENMKWIFDVKIKSHTEPYRKELFLCNGCVGNVKFYGFEGVVQHYAAKHTSALSVGSVVVHWRTEWPEVPPFSPDPRLPEIPRHSQPPGTSLSSTAVQPYATYGAYHSGPPAGYPTPSYGAPAPSHQFVSGQPSPFSPANVHDPRGPSAYAAPNHIPHYAQDGGYASYPPRPSYGTPNHPSDPPGGYEYASSAPHGFNYGPYPVPRGPYDKLQPPGGLYGTRLDTMIRVARDAWKKISGVKGLPPSVKICVVVHCIAKTFQDAFAEPAPLEMLIDGLSNQKEMRPIRNTNGLDCKACSMGHSVAEKTNFSLPQLVNHFNKAHIEGLVSQGLPPMDWRIEMILLPDMSVLQGLKRILENHRPAYELVASTLPWAFKEEQPDHHSKRMPWPRPMDQPLKGMEHETDDHPPARASHYDTHISELDVHEVNGIPSAIKDSRRNGHERTRKPEILGDQINRVTQTHSPTFHEIPNLRPASEVYARAKSRVDMQGRHPHEVSRRGSPPIDRYPGPDTVWAEQGDRREVSTDHGRSGSSHDHRMTHVRDDYGLDYRDAESQRYASRAHPRERAVALSDRRDRALPPSERWEEQPRRLERPLEPPPVTTHPEDDEFGLLGALESHLEMAHEEIVYVDQSGREIGRTTRPLEARPTPTQFPRFRYRDDPGRGPDMHHRPPSPRYDEHPMTGYQERDPGPKYAPQTYRHEPEPVPRRVYYDDPRPRPGPPVEAYELVEVRDPQGDYFIKRPIRTDEHESYAYAARPVPRDSEVYPPYGPVIDYPTTRTLGYVTAPRPVSLAPGRPKSRMECDEYDPRYPATGPEPAQRQSRR